METTYYYRLVNSEPPSNELGLVYYDEHASCWRWDGPSNGAYETHKAALAALGSLYQTTPVHVVRGRVVSTHSQPQP